MKLTRAHLGKVAKVVWRDPGSNPKRQTLTKAWKGRSALATWEEYGIIDDITDGVARIVHSLAHDPPADPDPETEIYCTWVVEELIESVTFLGEAPLVGAP